MFSFLCIRWLEQKLIPNFPPNSVIVLDNASYHKVQDDKPPSFSSKRVVMKVWLDTRGNRYPEVPTKVELFQFAKINKPTFQLFSNTVFWQDIHLVGNIAEELVMILESSDSDMSEEDEDNSLEGILPLSPDSE
jgi:hypothetical protein